MPPKESLVKLLAILADGAKGDRSNFAPRVEDAKGADGKIGPVPCFTVPEGYPLAQPVTLSVHARASATAKDFAAFLAAHGPEVQEALRTHGIVPEKEGSGQWAAGSEKTEGGGEKAESGREKGLARSRWGSGRKVRRAEARGQSGLRSLPTPPPPREGGKRPRRRLSLNPTHRSRRPRHPAHRPQATRKARPTQGLLSARSLWPQPRRWVCSRCISRGGKAILPAVAQASPPGRETRGRRPPVPCRAGAGSLGRGKRPDSGARKQRKTSALAQGDAPLYPGACQDSRFSR